jgi:hypothetical protein
MNTWTFAAFATFGWKKLGEDRVKRFHDHGAGDKLLNLFGGRCGMPDRKPLVVGSNRIGDVDDDLVCQIARRL